MSETMDTDVMDTEAMAPVVRRWHRYLYGTYIAWLLLLAGSAIAVVPGGGASILWCLLLLVLPLSFWPAFHLAHARGLIWFSFVLMLYWMADLLHSFDPGVRGALAIALSLADGVLLAVLYLFLRKVPGAAKA